MQSRLVHLKLGMMLRLTNVAALVAYVSLIALLHVGAESVQVVVPLAFMTQSHTALDVCYARRQIAHPHSYRSMSRMCTIVHLIAITVFTRTSANALPLRQVTCGSTVKVQHTATGHLLHSHDITYGSGSGQQSITGFPGGDDANSYWIVRGPEVGCPGLRDDIRDPSFPHRLVSYAKCCPETAAWARGGCVCRS